MVFLHEVGRESTEVRPTNDIDLVLDLRIDPAALGHTHTVLARASFSQDLPSPDGVAHRYRRGKATAVTEVVSMSSAERAKHLRDVDALARLLGPADRAGASLTTKERSTLVRIAEHPDLSPLAARSIQLTTAAPRV